jgi:hypothetical protein
VLCPQIDQISVGGAFKEHRSKEVFATAGSDETCAWTAIAGLLAINFLSTRGITMRTESFGLKAAFIDVNDVLPAALFDDSAQLLQKRNAFFWVALFVL